ncbi:MAG TPA: methyl-accepting chemotaxis protein [Spirochaetota bacterium]|nr:methyl-accepting chemotaxis protein [Spirochaetota bacterium]HSA15459.1 methyl-accepting chemotaxis protein [Spirochaetota bacterium]
MDWKTITSFYNKSLSKRVLIVCIGVTTISMIVIIMTNYFITKRSIQGIITGQLQYNVDTLHNIVDNAYDDFKLHLAEIARNNKTTAEKLYATDGRYAVDSLKRVLLSQQIGKEGYTYCFDSNGIVRIHPKPEMIGYNGSNLDFVKKTIKLKNGIIEYPWANPGEKKKRPKVQAFTYCEPLDLYICVTAYLEEFINKSVNLGKDNKTSISFASLKDRIIQYKIGENGYAYVMNSQGDLIAHPTMEGQNVLEYDYIKEIIKEKNGINIYTYEGKKKITAFKYFTQLDWYIVAGSYYNDFFDRPMLPLRIASAVMIIIFSVLLSFIIYKIIDSQILGPIKNSETMAVAIAQGDLTTTFTYDEDREDEIGLMMKSMSEMNGIIRTLVMTLAGSTEKLSKSSSMMDQVSKKISSMSQTQAASMEETSAALEQTSASMEQIAGKAQDQYQRVDKNAERMANMAKEAQKSLDEAIRVTEMMNKTMDDAQLGEVDLNRMVEEMQNIKSSTSKIAEIIKIISDISEQVNLLSLNAAIEAARAGDHGKGFAVVADEISKLAEETASSAKNITNLVKAGNQQVDSGSAIVNRTAQTFHHIFELIQTVSGSMSNFSETLTYLAKISSEARERTGGIKQISNDVSVASQEQMTTNREISKTIEKVNESSQELVNYAESIRNSSSEIAQISADIMGQLNKFRF